MSWFRNFVGFLNPDETLTMTLCAHNTKNALKLSLALDFFYGSLRGKPRVVEERVSTNCKWELLQSVCFDEDTFLCLLRGCGKKYFSFVSENSKIKKLREFEELIEAQEHFFDLFNKLSKEKMIEMIRFSPLWPFFINRGDQSISFVYLLFLFRV